MQLTEGEDYDSAETLLLTECDVMRAKFDASELSEHPALAWSELMQARISNGLRAESEAVPSLRSELDATVGSALEKHPASIQLMSKFIEVRLREISRIMREEPESAQQRLEQTVAAVDASPLKDDATLQRTITQPSRMKHESRRLNWSGR